MVKKGKKNGNKYEQIPEDQLDLHGYYADEAYEETRLFLDHSEKERLSCVRIIVGKGNQSAVEGGVLGDVVRRLLNERGYRYRDAKITDGGSGAVIVSLQ